MPVMGKTGSLVQVEILLDGIWSAPLIEIEEQMQYHSTK